MADPKVGEIWKNPQGEQAIILGLSENPEGYLIVGRNRHPGIIPLKSIIGWSLVSSGLDTPCSHEGCQNKAIAKNLKGVEVCFNHFPRHQPILLPGDDPSKEALPRLTDILKGHSKECPVCKTPKLLQHRDHTYSEDFGYFRCSCGALILPLYLTSFNLPKYDYFKEDLEKSLKFVRSLGFESIRILAGAHRLDRDITQETFSQLGIAKEGIALDLDSKTNPNQAVITILGIPKYDNAEVEAIKLQKVELGSFWEARSRHTIVEICRIAKGVNPQYCLKKFDAKGQISYEFTSGEENFRSLYCRVNKSNLLKEFKPFNTSPITEDIPPTFLAFDTVTEKITKVLSIQDGIVTIRTGTSTDCELTLEEYKASHSANREWTTWKEGTKYIWGEDNPTSTFSSLEPPYVNLLIQGEPLQIKMTQFFGATVYKEISALDRLLDDPL